MSYADETPKHAMTSVPASKLVRPSNQITMLMKNKAQSCIGAVTHLFINRSDAAAVAQRPVHEVRNCGSRANPGFESLAAVGDPHLGT